MLNKYHAHVRSLINRSMDDLEQGREENFRATYKFKGKIIIIIGCKLEGDETVDLDKIKEDEQD